MLRQFVKERQKEGKLMKEKKGNKGLNVFGDEEEKVERKMSIIDRMMLEEGESDDDNGEANERE